MTPYLFKNGKETVSSPEKYNQINFWSCMLTLGQYLGSFWGKSPFLSGGENDTHRS